MKNSKYTHLRVTCTNCGVTQKTRNWYNQAERHILIKECYNCNSYISQVKKDNKNDNLLSQTI
jgi:formate dehydrogenase maturation protein FdhE